MKKTIAVLLALAFTAPAYAGQSGPIAASAEKVTRELALAPAGVKPPNPYLWPSLGLIAGGATLAAVGFLRTTGADIEFGACGLYDTDCSITASEKHNTGLGVAGLGIAGSGVVLMLLGESKRGAVADVSFGPRQVTVTRTFTF